MNWHGKGWGGGRRRGRGCWRSAPGSRVPSVTLASPPWTRSGRGKPDGAGKQRGACSSSRCQDTPRMWSWEFLCQGWEQSPRRSCGSLLGMRCPRSSRWQPPTADRAEPSGTGCREGRVAAFGPCTGRAGRRCWGLPTLPPAGHSAVRGSLGSSTAPPQRSAQGCCPQELRKGGEKLPTSAERRNTEVVSLSPACGTRLSLPPLLPLPLGSLCTTSLRGAWAGAGSEH